MISNLETYLDNNKLEINIKKTKVIIFRKGGRGHKTNLTFKYKEAPIDFAKEYVYLGITFTQSGSYNKTAKNSISKGYKATQPTLNILNRLKITNIETCKKLF